MHPSWKPPLLQVFHCEEVLFSYKLKSIQIYTQRLPRKHTRCNAESLKDLSYIYYIYYIHFVLLYKLFKKRSFISKLNEFLKAITIIIAK